MTKAEPPDFRKTLFRAALFVVASGLVLALVYVTARFWFARQDARLAMTSDPTPIAIRISQDRLTVPANVIRMPDQRRGGGVPRLDLMFLWPEFEGMSELNRRAFTGEEAANFVHVGIARRNFDADMSARLNAIYGKLVEPGPRAGPAGLALYDFKPGKGYDGEVLAVAPNGRSGEQFVMRCEQLVDDRPATCMRDIHLGNSLSATYLIDRGLLPHWRSIEADLRAVLGSYLTPG